MDKKIPGVPSVSSVKDEETRKVLQALIDGWRLRNGHTNDGGAQFVTRDELEKFMGSGDWDGSGFRSGTGSNGPTARMNVGGISGAFRDHVARIIEEIKNSLLWKSLSSRIDRLDGKGGVLDRIGLTETGVKHFVEQTNTKIETIDAQLVLIDPENIAAAVENITTEVAEGYARTFSTTTLQAMVDGGNLMAQEALDIINAPGSTTSATWQVKFDIDGYVVGAGLGLEGKDGVYTSQFLVKADRFAVGTPGDDPVFPFIADEDGVYINGNLYVNAGGPSLEDLALDAGIALSASGSHWYVDSDSLPVNTSIILQATLRTGLTGTVAWSKTGTGTAAPAAGTTNTWTIYAADQTGDITTYTATLVSGGKTYTKSLEISRVSDGERGVDGVAGTMGSLTGYGSAYSIVSASWSDGIANRVIYNMLTGESLTSSLASTTHLVLGDTVTLSNGTSFAATRYWSGLSWLTPGAVIDGNLLVNGTVSATKITAGQISTSGGNALINIGTTSFVGDITSPLHATKSSAVADQALITASNNKDDSVCIWGASTYASGNAVSGTWHSSDAERNAGRWTSIGILGSNYNSAAVAGNVYGNSATQVGGYFRFNTSLSDVAPVTTNYVSLASINRAILANGKVQLFGAGSSIILGTNEGTAGQVLTSAGSGATPTWTDPSGGGITYAGLQGVTSGTTGSALSLSTTFRATGLNAPASGAGIELAYNTGVGYVTAYNRTSGTYQPVVVSGSTVELSYQGAARISIGSANGATLNASPATADNSTAIATTAYVKSLLTSTVPSALGTAAAGNATDFARANHVHAAPKTINGYKCYGGSGTSSTGGSVTVTFPAAFSNTTNLGVSAVAQDGYVATVTGITTSTVTFKVNNMSGTGTSGIAIRWTAVGS